tara:strand:- start:2576 stop:4402 length:1827 start_codon:yes stop_codon:yes gene_type:complete
MHMPELMGTKRCRLQHADAGFRQMNPFGLGRLLLKINMVLISMMLLGIMPSTAKAELDLEDCVGAWLEARSWVDDLAVPEKTVRTSLVPNASAACIILRHRGRTVGVGLSHSDDTDPSDAPLIQDATRLAVRAALKDQTITALPESVRTDAGRNLVMEMEIAGPLQALLGRSIEVAAERIQPGVHGIAMRYGDRWWFEFPSQLRMSNAAAGPQRILALALTSELSPRQIENLRNTGEVSLYRFETVNLAQTESGDMPRMLTCGDIPVIQSEVTPERIAQSRDALAKHLLGRIFTSADGTRLVGSYTPLAASFKTQPPTERERAIVALSLARYSRNPAVDPELANAARTAAAELIEGSLSEPDMVGSGDPLEASATYLAARELNLDDGGRQIDIIRNHVLKLRESGDLVIRKQASSVVFVCAALMKSPSEDDMDLAVEMSRKARDTMPVQQQVTLLPWLGWIERDNRTRLESPSSNPDLNALQFIRRQTMNLQAPPSFDNKTLNAGGYILEPGPRGVTSRSFRPALFIAETISDPGYLDSDQADVLAAHLRFLRYMMQLSCREDVAGTWRQPDRVIGAIRESCWDAELDPVTQAMGLMVLSEPISNTDP